MTNYTKTTDFAAKDALPSGNAAKIVKGSEIDAEFNNIATSSATKANKNNSALTGTTTFETISDGTIAITAFVDEDNMVSNSATLLPTQQSVKAYVDSQVTAQDLDFQADTGGALSIDLDSETITFTGGTGIDTSGALNAVTFAIDSTVATLTGTQTLSNKTLSTPAVSGNLTTDGLIDGRDVATDGTKLDGIESGATADQTAAEIKTAYESNLNTNAFTDADESKLDGIEASADVTDTANVTAAGALMDSELTNITAVKALNQGVATTDSPTFAGLTTTADVSFGDNDKAIFGAGSDLQIYHSGSASIIEDTGTGDLVIKGTDLYLRNASNSNRLYAGTDTRLYYDGNEKIRTTSTGIDVTGTAAADKLIVNSGATDEVARFEGTGSPYISWYDTGVRQAYIGSFGNNFSIVGDTPDTTVSISTGGTPRLTVDATGVGIGTSSPASNLEISDSTQSTGATFSITNSHDGLWTSGDKIGSIDFRINDGSATQKVRAKVHAEGRTTGTYPADSDLVFSTADNNTLSEAMRIDSAGDLTVKGGRIKVRESDDGNDAVVITRDADEGYVNVYSSGTQTVEIRGNGNSYFNGGNLGIGTSSPTKTLVVNENDSECVVVIKSSDTGSAGVYLGGQSDEIKAGMILDNSTNALIFRGYNNAERLRISSTGNVGIGTSSPGNFQLNINGSGDGGRQLKVEGPSTNGLMRFSNSTSQDYSIGINSTSFIIYDDTANSYRMLVDSSGNLLVGTTTAGYASQSGFAVNPDGASYVAVAHPNGASSGNTYALFTYNAGIIGSITQNGTTSVNYNTSSDQRLKENIADADDAGSKVDSIQVRKFDWIADGTHQDYGMIAQELQSVAPEAVSTPEDPEEMMGVDYSKLVPMLVKEIQSLRARVAQLEN